MASPATAIPAHQTHMSLFSDISRGLDTPTTPMPCKNINDSILEEELKTPTLSGVTNVEPISSTYPEIKLNINLKDNKLFQRRMNRKNKLKNDKSPKQ